MSKCVFSIAAFAASLFSARAHAAPSGGLLATPPPMHAHGDWASQAVAQGQVQRMLINPYGEVDGLRLADGTIVKFPPHVSDTLTAVIKPGDMVRVIGRPEARGTVKADVIVNTASGQTVYVQPPTVGEGRSLPPHLRALRLQPQKVEVRGDGSTVRFLPESLRLSVQPGAPFASSGPGTRNATGTSLEAMSLGTSLANLQPLYDRAP